MTKFCMHDEQYFNFDSYADTVACDFHSVEAGLDKILDGNLRLGYVDEDYNNILINAADLSCMLYRVIDELSVSLPQKSIGYDDERGIGIFWFNSAVALYNGTDMDTLADNEEKYDINEYNEKSLRLRAVNSLTKEQHMYLLVKTYGIVFRYIRLKFELDALCGVDDELGRLHSSKKKDGNTELPKSAWL